MIKPLWTLLAAVVLTTYTAGAQTNRNTQKNENKNQSDNKVKEKKEITIEEKTKTKSEKMVIVIDGDKITINGKPADEYKGDKHIIIDDDIVINGDHVMVPGRARTMVRTTTSNRAMLGVVTENDDKGAKIKEITKESGAEKAGLKQGDVITQVNGKDIKNHSDLVASIGKMKPDDDADITYLRDGKEQKVKAKLGKAPRAMAYSFNQGPVGDFNFHMDPPVAMTAPRAPRPFVWNDNDMWMFRTDRPKYGMSIETNTDGDGVKVTGVEAESNAMKAGIKENDIITEVDGKAVKGVDDLREMLAEARENNSVNVKVLRNGAPQNLTVKVPKVIKKADL